MRGAHVRILALAGALLLLAPLVFIAHGEGLRMDVYVYDPCGGCGTVGVGCKSCTVIDEIANRYRLLLSDWAPEMVFYNLRMDRAFQDACDKRLEAVDASPDAAALPLVWIGDAVFQADGSMDDSICAYLNAGFSGYPGLEALIRQKSEFEEKAASGAVVYLYSRYCEDCIDVSRRIRNCIPQGYELVAYDIYTEEGQKMEQLLIENMGIGAEDYCIPFVAYGPYWFAGRESIYLSLKSRIQENPGLLTTTLVKIQE